MVSPRSVSMLQSNICSELDCLARLGFKAYVGIGFEGTRGELLNLQSSVQVPSLLGCFRMSDPDP